MIFVYIFVGLIVFLLILSAFMSKTFHVEKTIVISKPVTDVMKKIFDFNYYNKWNPWQLTDPKANYQIVGQPGVPGHKYSWQGKKVGIGNLTLRDLDAKHIHFDLEFLKPWKSKAKDNWLFEAWGDGETKVTWQNSGGLPWPMARLMAPMIIKTLNRQFQEGLNNLKRLVEGS